MLPDNCQSNFERIRRAALARREANEQSGGRMRELRSGTDQHVPELPIARVQIKKHHVPATKEEDRMSVRRDTPNRLTLYRECAICGRPIVTTAATPWMRMVEEQ